MVGLVAVLVAVLLAMSLMPGVPVKGRLSQGWRICRNMPVVMPAHLLVFVWKCGVQGGS